MLASLDRVSAPRQTGAVERPRFAALINTAAASGAGSAARRFERAAMAGLGADLLDVVHTRSGHLQQAISQALATGANAVLIFGGDGTARTALESLTPHKVAVAPLPGGTLNRLSRAVYGVASLDDLMIRIAHGARRGISGGCIGERRFFVASGYGEPMRLQRAREALRARRPGDALRRIRQVCSALADRRMRVGSFGARAGCVLVGVGPIDAAFGLAPRQAPVALEAAATTFRSFGDLLGFAPAALSGAWRRRPDVSVCGTKALQIESVDGSPIPALLDGEYERLPPKIVIRYEPQAGLIWS